MKQYVDQLLNSLVKDSCNSLLYNLEAAEREALPNLHVDSLTALRIRRGPGGHIRTSKPGVCTEALHIEAGHRAVVLSHIVGWHHKPNNASGSTDLAQMIINGAMAAVQNRQAVNQRRM